MKAWRKAREWATETAIEAVTGDHLSLRTTVWAQMAAVAAVDQGHGTTAAVVSGVGALVVAVDQTVGAPDYDDDEYATFAEGDR